MAGNYVLLERIELNASASSVTFSNIPQSGYTDLKIVMSLRSTDTSSNSGYYDALLTRFNNSTSNYSGREIYAYQNTPYSGTLTTATSTIAGGTWGRLTGVGVNNSNSSATASTFTSIDLYLPNYTSSNYKSYSLDLAEEQNASYSTLGMTAGLWSDTTAISTIAFALKDGSFTQYSTFSLYGLAAVGTTPAIAPKATGGNLVTTDGTYWYHAFTSSGTFTPLGGITCDYLVVAGGGGGSYDAGGGGGAGGLRSTVTATGGGGSLESALSLTAQAYTVTIGAGGVGALTGSRRGGNGSDSTFSTITSTGGGGGGTAHSGGLDGSAGGSGGGGSRSGGNGGARTTGQGYAGGSGTGGTTGAGGGGGAGATGGNASTGGGAGGNGVQLTAFASATGTGVSNYYAGGGGGGSNTTPAAAGGSGGGGQGGTPGGLNITPGTANTGGGGGGCGGGDSTGTANGGSGIVIVRYAV